MMRITNTSKAVQGVHSVTGLVHIEPGATREVDVALNYVDRVRKLPFLVVDGEAPPVPAEDTVTVSRAAMDQYKAQWEGLGSEIADLRTENERLQGEVERLTALVPATEEKSLADMTRAELDALAAERGVDISDAKNKGDVIAALELAAEAAKA